MAKRKKSTGKIGGKHAIIPSASVATAMGVTLPKQTGEKWLSPNQVGKILNVTGEAVKQWIYNHRLPAVKIANGYWKIKVSDLETYLKVRNEFGRRRILLAVANADQYKAVIEEMGHDAIIATNHADALLKVADRQPSLAVIEVGAAVDGWKIARGMRNNNQVRNCPILIVSGQPLGEADVEQALEIKAVAHVDSLENFKLEIKRLIG